MNEGISNDLTELSADVPPLVPENIREYQLVIKHYMVPTNSKSKESSLNWVWLRIKNTLMTTIMMITLMIIQNPETVQNPKGSE